MGGDNSCVRPGARSVAGDDRSDFRNADTPAGRRHPGANATVINEGQGTVFTRTTDQTGSCTVPFLIPGTYRVTAEQPGFRKAEQRDIVVTVNAQMRLDITLGAGNVTETVEVTAAAPLVRSASAETGRVIEQRAVQELPLNRRNFARLACLGRG